MFLLDTHVISELRKARADSNVQARARSVPPASLLLSAASLLELETGILRLERRDAIQGLLLRTWLDKQVIPAFAGRVLPIDTAVALRCARLHVPDRSNYSDALIAATALVHRLTVVTRNIDDFQATGAALLDPWD